MTQATEKKLPIEGGEVFSIEGRTAFLIMPEASTPEELTPWVWYAPTLEGLPEAEEKWMLETFLSSGIAIAGVDVGESYGSPEGRKVYSKFYKNISEKRGLAPKACLLARSRGGLMLYNWAAENPQSVACIAGIYPVCNLRSFPGLKRACSAYDMTKEELAAELSENNPIDRLAPLAAAKVPIFHIHGDSDGLVPLDQNSAVVKERYEQLGGEMELTVFKGRGHTTWSGWFENQEAGRLCDCPRKKPVDQGEGQRQEIAAPTVISSASLRSLEGLRKNLLMDYTSTIPQQTQKDYL